MKQEVEKKKLQGMSTEPVSLGRELKRFDLLRFLKHSVSKVRITLIKMQSRLNNKRFSRKMASISLLIQKVDL